MTAKEKAKELVEKFTIDLRPFSEYGHWDEYQGKQCALLCVDEVIKEIQWSNSLVVFGNQIKAKMDSNICFWNKVKKEIELL